MLSKRFDYDNSPALALNGSQAAAKKEVEDKINAGLYKFEKKSCCICAGDNFEALSEKDRYGLHCYLMVCKTCGLIQQNPRMDSAGSFQFYQSEYTRLRFPNSLDADDYFNVMYKKASKVYDYIKSRIFLETMNLRVFEIGCAAGGILKYFRDQGNEVSGIDINANYVNFGREKYGLALKAESAQDFSLSFLPDLVICCNLLEHLNNPLEVMKRLWFLLPAGAYVYIRTPGLKVIEKRCGRDFLHHIQLAHFYEFTLKALRNLMRKSGFKFICGSEAEQIQAIFIRPADFSECNAYENAYCEEKLYLERLERSRFLPNMYKIRHYVKKCLVWPLRKR